MIDIQILDDNNRFINFNNVNWTITLAITKFKKMKIDSTTTFQDATTKLLEMKLLDKPLDDKNLNEKPLEDIPLPFTDDNDLDFFMYKNGIDI